MSSNVDESQPGSLPWSPLGDTILSPTKRFTLNSQVDHIERAWDDPVQRKQASESMHHIQRIGSMMWVPFQRLEEAHKRYGQQYGYG